MLVTEFRRVLFRSMGVCLRLHMVVCMRGCLGMWVTKPMLCSELCLAVSHSSSRHSLVWESYHTHTPVRTESPSEVPVVRRLWRLQSESRVEPGEGIVCETRRWKTLISSCKRLTPNDSVDASHCVYFIVATAFLCVHSCVCERELCVNVSAYMSVCTCVHLHLWPVCVSTVLCVCV